MVNESCLGFDPKFLELKEEVHVRKRERKRDGEKRGTCRKRILNFIVLMHVYFSSSLLISFPSPSYRTLLIQLISVYSQ